MSIFNFNKRSKQFLLWGVLAITFNMGFAMHASAQQDRFIRGRIADSDGAPLPGSSVWIKETSVGTTTDAEGNYVIKISDDIKNPILVASFIGYNKVEEVVNKRTTIDFILSESSEQIEDVVVVGYGVQKRESVVGSISTVKPNQLRLPTGQISTALAGQLAGVISIQRSGEPG
jgi:hypothetical protein